MGSAVNFEALRRLDFHRVVVAGVHRQEDPAIAAGGDGIHQLAVHLPNFKGHALDALGLVRLGDLDQLQTAHRGVVEGQGLHLAGLDLNGLRRAVQHIPVQRLGFLGGNGGAGLQVGDGDAAVLISIAVTVVGVGHRAGAVGDQELHALHGLVLGAFHKFLDDEGGGGVILKIEIVPAAGAGVTASAAGNETSDGHCA